MAIVSISIPIYVNAMGDNPQQVQEFINSSLYPERYLLLLTGAYMTSFSTSTIIAAGTASLFGTFSGGRTLTFIRSSRLLALAFALIPVYFNDWHTNMVIYYVMAGLIGVGVIAALFLNPYALVHEPTDPFERSDENRRNNKYSSIMF